MPKISRRGWVKSTWTKKADRSIPERIGDALHIPSSVCIKTPNLWRGFGWVGWIWYYGFRRDIIDYLKSQGVKPQLVWQFNGHVMIQVKRSQYKWAVGLAESAHLDVINTKVKGNVRF